jgi:mannosyltransferase OCH1-like enzyme
MNNKMYIYIAVISVFIITLIIVIVVNYSNSQQVTIPFYIPRTIQYQYEDTNTIVNINSLTFNNIPAVIYQTGYSKKVSKKIGSIINMNLENNPEFDYYFYDDNDCLNFIKDNYSIDVVNAYTKLKPGAFKADLWRYCILYKNGGIYIDVKFIIKTPLIKYLQTHSTSFVADIDDDKIYNAILIAPPKLDIFKKAIDNIVINVSNKYYGRSCLDPTGPGLFGKLIYNSEYEKYISMFFDKKQTDIITIKDKETNEIIFQSYSRNEYYFQFYVSNNKTHYGYLWNKKNIYNE